MANSNSLIFPDMFAIPQNMNMKDVVRAYTQLYIGGTQCDYYMIDVSGGNQNARLQVEATLDGGLFVIGCKGGIGSYKMSFYEGPFTACKDTGSSVPDSIIKKYISLENLPDKLAQVYIYRDKDSSEVVGKFDGILNNMSTTLVSEGQFVFLKVTLDMLGSWQA